MNAPELLACCLCGATGWSFAKVKASAMLAREHAKMKTEILRCQDETAVARVRAAQLEQEITTWYKGCQQGREDVMAVMPLLLAAHARITDAEIQKEVSAEL
jgi:hypothetical protein